ncbi:hypothetical protein GCM10010517_30850 [Streptosporangium fragile]|uniref:Uncharacterized protein n=1 Tax=Streptosporangium fragile TaxID=46186 RepID=A0ABP6IFW2_9ACTN
MNRESRFRRGDQPFHGGDSVFKGLKVTADRAEFLQQRLKVGGLARLPAFRKRITDEDPFALMGYDKTLYAKFTYRAANHGDGHAVVLHQLVVGGDLAAGGIPPPADLSPEVIGHLLVGELT